jgi:hypothetical protein
MVILMSYFDKAQGSPEDHISNSLPSFRNVNVEQHITLLSVVLLCDNFVVFGRVSGWCGGNFEGGGECCVTISIRKGVDEYKSDLTSKNLRRPNDMADVHNANAKLLRAKQPQETFSHDVLVSAHTKTLAALGHHRQRRKLRTLD